MSTNVIEQAIRPEVPDVIPNEFFYVYVPKATTTNPGIASFDADDFNVANGVVTIDTTKWGDKTYINGKLVASANRIVRGSTNYLVAVDTTLKTVNITSTDSETLEDGTVRSIPTTYNIPFKAGQGTTFVLNDNIIAIKSDVGRLGSVDTAEIFNDYAGNVATGNYSHAEGKGTIASGQAQHVFGKYNISDSSNIEIVGAGTDDDNRANIRTLSSSGDQWIAGKHSQEGTPTNDKDLTTKLYVDTIASSLNDDITSLQAIVGTGENYIGQLSGDTLPSSSDLDDYVQEQEGRTPKGGDTIMFVLYVTGGEDEIYKYMYNGTTWASFMIPAVEVSSNGELGVVKGTYGIGSSNDILVDIVNGEIKNIYAKDKDSNYVKMGLPASITETVTSVAAGTTGYDITCEVTEERVDNTSFSYDQVRNLPIVGGTGISLSVEDNLVKIDAEVTKSYVDNQDNAVKSYVDGKDTTINNRITDSSIRINNLERSVYGELADWSDETFLALKNAILPSTITVDSSTYNVVDEANSILSSLKGNTKQFNQPIQNGNFANGTSDWTTFASPEFSVSSNVATLVPTREYSSIRSKNVPYVSGHKYLLSFVYTNGNTSSKWKVYSIKGSSDYVLSKTTIGYASTETKASIIFTALTSGNVPLVFQYDGTADFDTSTLTLQNVQLIDLTAMGLDSITTVDEFTALYPKSYYDYNAGTLYNSKISGLALTGRNLIPFTKFNNVVYGGITFDGRSGELKLSGTNAETIPSNAEVYKNANFVLKAGTYYLQRKTVHSGTYVRIKRYEDDTNLISDTGTSCVLDKDTRVYLSMYIDPNTSFGNEYVCQIMLSSVQNATYAPYALHTISLPSAQTVGGLGDMQDTVSVTKNTDDDYYTIKKSVVTNNSALADIPQWNQPLENGNFASNAGWTSYYYGNTISVSNNECRVYGGVTTTKDTSHSVATIPAGHKVYIQYDAKGTGYTRFVFFSASEAMWSEASENTENYTTRRGIITLTYATSRMYLQVGGSLTVEAYFKNAMFVDLTAVFGAGNEPTTVADIPQWIKEKDYFAYKAIGSGVDVSQKHNYVYNTDSDVTWTGAATETTITTTATLAEVSAIRTNGGMISVVGNDNEDYAQPDVSETILHSVTPNA